MTRLLTSLSLLSAVLALAWRVGRERRETFGRTFSREEWESSSKPKAES